MKRSGVALSFLLLIIGVIAFFQTPLMAAARVTTWDYITLSVAKLFNIGDVVVEADIAEKVQRLTVDNIRLEAELRDYRRLREQLATPSVANTRPVPAAILARTSDTLQSELVLSRGLSSGIAIGDPVVVFGSNIIGVVIEAGTHSARVRTLFHPDSHITVEVINEDEEVLPARGLLSGVFYSALEVTTIPRDIAISPGQSIVTVRDDATIPYGLVIGTVESVQSKETEAYQSTRVRVPYDIDTIDAVTVLTQP